MSRFFILMTLVLGGAGTAAAGTMERTAIAPEYGVDVLDREAAREHLGRELFSNPYAGVVIANIDVYDRFPYLESRYFQVVSDPGWNRLLAGETGKGPVAFDGTGTPFGRLSEPRGIAQGHGNRIFVCDSGNDRVLVLDIVTEFDRIALVPVESIPGLRRPYDAAYSDRGTPDDPSDDRLYVAEAGANRVTGFSFGESGAVRVSTIGGLGSGPGRFAGPLAVAVGRRNGAATPDVFVADSHNRRVVRLRDDGNSLRWAGERPHLFDVVTSLDTDHWGNLYLAGPNRGVAKLSADLEPLAEVTAGTARPRSFHVVFARIHDHTAGTEQRAGQPKGVLLESWSPGSGISLMNLGVDLRNLQVDVRDGITAGFLLTDRSRVTAEIADPVTGSIMARLDGGVLDSGSRSLRFTGESFFGNLTRGSYVLRLVAEADHDETASARTEAVFSTPGTAFDLPGRLQLLGNSPNPFTASTRIRFLVPDGGPVSASVRIFDLQGRLLRTLLDGERGPGLVSVDWNGTDDGGRSLGAGIYFYRVVVDDASLVSRMILIR